MPGSFPQGGIQEGESVEQALLRELKEEVGLTERDVEIVACTEGGYVIVYHSGYCVGRLNLYALVKSKNGFYCGCWLMMPRFALITMNNQSSIAGSGSATGTP